MKNFGVNLTRMAPGAVSSLHHSHTRQDEFLYVLEGEPTLLTNGDKVKLAPGMCAGFPANGPAHHLENRTDKEVLVLEIGDRVADDQLLCPNDDLATVVGPDGKWRFTHKDGRPY
ncbi:MAG TPA: cupin domain-containing protein [Anaeromyxobacteraceae bacterium]|nr:cupin domain-containing protein [Anaeromyxobacteraceae bacterium]